MVAPAPGVQLRVVDASRGDCSVLTVNRNVFIIDGGVGSTDQATSNSSTVPDRNKSSRTLRSNTIGDSLRGNADGKISELSDASQSAALDRLVRLEKSVTPGMTNFHNLITTVLKNKVTGLVLSHIDIDHWGGIYYCIVRLSLTLNWIPSGMAQVPRYITASGPSAFRNDVASSLATKSAKYKDVNDCNLSLSLLASGAPAASSGVLFHQCPGADPQPLQLYEATWPPSPGALAAGKRKLEDVTEDSSSTNRSSVLSLVLEFQNGGDNAYNKELQRLSCPSILFTGDSTAMEIIKFNHQYVRDMLTQNKAIKFQNTPTQYLTILKIPHHGGDHNSFLTEDRTTQKNDLFGGIDNGDLSDEKEELTQNSAVEQLLLAWFAVCCVAYSTLPPNQTDPKRDYLLSLIEMMIPYCLTVQVVSDHKTPKKKPRDTKLTTVAFVGKVAQLSTELTKLPVWKNVNVGDQILDVDKALRDIEIALFDTHFELGHPPAQTKLLDRLSDLRQNSTFWSKICDTIITNSPTSTARALWGSVGLIRGLRIRHLTAAFYLKMRAKMFIFPTDSSSHGHPRLDTVLGVALASVYYKLAQPVVLFHSAKKPYQRNWWTAGLRQHMTRMMNVVRAPQNYQHCLVYANKVQAGSNIGLIPLHQALNGALNVAQPLQTVLNECVLRESEFLGSLATITVPPAAGRVVNPSATSSSALSMVTVPSVDQNAVSHSITMPALRVPVPVAPFSAGQLVQGSAYMLAVALLGASVVSTCSVPYFFLSVLQSDGAIVRDSLLGRDSVNIPQCAPSSTVAARLYRSMMEDLPLLTSPLFDWTNSNCKWFVQPNGSITVVSFLLIVPYPSNTSAKLSEFDSGAPPLIANAQPYKLSITYNPYGDNPTSSIGAPNFTLSSAFYTTVSSTTARVTWARPAANTPQDVQNFVSSNWTNQPNPPTPRQNTLWELGSFFLSPQQFNSRSVSFPDNLLSSSVDLNTSVLRWADPVPPASSTFPPRTVSSVSLALTPTSTVWTLQSPSFNLVFNIVSTALSFGLSDAWSKPAKNAGTEFELLMRATCTDSSLETRGTMSINRSSDLDFRVVRVTVNETSQFVAQDVARLLKDLTRFQSNSPFADMESTKALKVPLANRQLQQMLGTSQNNNVFGSVQLVFETSLLSDNRVSGQAVYDWSSLTLSNKFLPPGVTWQTMFPMFATSCTVANERFEVRVVNPSTSSFINPSKTEVLMEATYSCLLQFPPSNDAPASCLFCVVDERPQLSNASIQPFSVLLLPWDGPWQFDDGCRDASQDYGVDGLLADVTLNDGSAWNVTSSFNNLSHQPIPNLATLLDAFSLTSQFLGLVPQIADIFKHIDLQSFQFSLDKASNSLLSLSFSVIVNTEFKVFNDRSIVLNNWTLDVDYVVVGPDHQWTLETDAIVDINGSLFNLTVRLPNETSMGFIDIDFSNTGANGNPSLADLVRLFTFGVFSVDSIPLVGQALNDIEIISFGVDFSIASGSVTVHGVEFALNSNATISIPLMHLRHSEFSLQWGSRCEEWNGGTKYFSWSIAAACQFSSSPTSARFRTSLSFEGGVTSLLKGSLYPTTGPVAPGSVLTSLVGNTSVSNSVVVTDSTQGLTVNLISIELTVSNSNAVSLKYLKISLNNVLQFPLESSVPKKWNLSSAFIQYDAADTSTVVAVPAKLKLGGIMQKLTADKVIETSTSNAGFSVLMDFTKLGSWTTGSLQVRVLPYMQLFIPINDILDLFELKESQLSEVPVDDSKASPLLTLFGVSEASITFDLGVFSMSAYSFTVQGDPSASFQLTSWLTLKEPYLHVEASSDTTNVTFSSMNLIMKESGSINQLKLTSATSPLAPLWSMIPLSAADPSNLSVIGANTVANVLDRNLDSFWAPNTTSPVFLQLTIGANYTNRSVIAVRLKLATDGIHVPRAVYVMPGAQTSTANSIYGAECSSQALDLDGYFGCSFLVPVVTSVLTVCLIPSSSTCYVYDAVVDLIAAASMEVAPFSVIDPFNIPVHPSSPVSNLVDDTISSIWNPRNWQSLYYLQFAINEDESDSDFVGVRICCATDGTHTPTGIYVLRGASFSTDDALVYFPCSSTLLDANGFLTCRIPSVYRTNRFTLALQGPSSGYQIWLHEVRAVIKTPSARLLTPVSVVDPLNLECYYDNTVSRLIDGFADTLWNPIGSVPQVYYVQLQVNQNEYTSGVIGVRLKLANDGTHTPSQIFIMNGHTQSTQSAIVTTPCSASLLDGDGYMLVLLSEALKTNKLTVGLARSPSGYQIWATQIQLLLAGEDQYAGDELVEFRALSQPMRTSQMLLLDASSTMKPRVYVSGRLDFGGARFYVEAEKTTATYGFGALLTPDDGGTFDFQSAARQIATAASDTTQNFIPASGSGGFNLNIPTQLSSAAASVELRKWFAAQDERLIDDFQVKFQASINSPFGFDLAGRTVTVNSVRTRFNYLSIATPKKTSWDVMFLGRAKVTLSEDFEFDSQIALEYDSNPAAISRITLALSQSNKETLSPDLTKLTEKLSGSLLDTEIDSIAVQRRTGSSSSVKLYFQAVWGGEPSKVSLAGVLLTQLKDFHLSGILLMQKPSTSWKYTVALSLDNTLSKFKLIDLFKSNTSILALGASFFDTLFTIQKATVIFSNAGKSIPDVQKELDETFDGVKKAVDADKSYFDPTNSALVLTQSPLAAFTSLSTFDGEGRYERADQLTVVVKVTTEVKGSSLWSKLISIGTANSELSNAGSGMEVLVNFSKLQPQGTMLELAAHIDTLTLLGLIRLDNLSVVYSRSSINNVNTEKLQAKSTVSVTVFSFTMRFTGTVTIESSSPEVVVTFSLPESEVDAPNENQVKSGIDWLFGASATITGGKLKFKPSQSVTTGTYEINGELQLPTMRSQPTSPIKVSVYSASVDSSLWNPDLISLDFDSIDLLDALTSMLDLPSKKTLNNVIVLKNGLFVNTTASNVIDSNQQTRLPGLSTTVAVLPDRAVSMLFNLTLSRQKQADETYLYSVTLEAVKPLFQGVFDGVVQLTRGISSENMMLGPSLTLTNLGKEDSQLTGKVGIKVCNDVGVAEVNFVADVKETFRFDLSVRFSALSCSLSYSKARGLNIENISGINIPQINLNDFVNAFIDLVSGSCPAAKNLAKQLKEAWLFSRKIEWIQDEDVQNFSGDRLTVKGKIAISFTIEVSTSGIPAWVLDLLDLRKVRFEAGFPLEFTIRQGDSLGTALLNNITNNLGSAFMVEFADGNIWSFCKLAIIALKSAADILAVVNCIADDRDDDRGAGFISDLTNGYERQLQAFVSQWKSLSPPAHVPDYAGLKAMHAVISGYKFPTQVPNNASNYLISLVDFVAKSTVFVNALDELVSRPGFENHINNQLRQPSNSDSYSQIVHDWDIESTAWSTHSICDQFGTPMINLQDTSATIATSNQSFICTFRPVPSSSSLQPGSQVVIEYVLSITLANTGRYTTPRTFCTTKLPATHDWITKARYLPDELGQVELTTQDKILLQAHDFTNVTQFSCAIITVVTVTATGSGMQTEFRSDPHSSGVSIPLPQPDIVSLSLVTSTAYTTAGVAYQPRQVQVSWSPVYDNVSAVIPHFIADYKVELYRQIDSQSDQKPSSDLLIQTVSLHAFEPSPTNLLLYSFEQVDFASTLDSSNPSDLANYGYYVRVKAVDEVGYMADSKFVASKSLHRTTAVNGSSLSCTYIPAPGNNTIKIKWDIPSAPANDSGGFVVAVIGIDPATDGASARLSQVVFTSDLLAPSVNSLTLVEATVSMICAGWKSVFVSVTRVSTLNMFDATSEAVQVDIISLPAPEELSITVDDVNNAGMMMRFRRVDPFFRVKFYQVTLRDRSSMGIVWSSGIDMPRYDNYTYISSYFSIKDILSNWSTRFAGQLVVQIDGTTSTTSRYPMTPSSFEWILAAVPGVMPANTLFLAGSSSMSAPLRVLPPPKSTVVQWVNSTAPGSKLTDLTTATVNIKFETPFFPIDNDLPTIQSFYSNFGVDLVYIVNGVSTVIKSTTTPIPAIDMSKQISVCTASMLITQTEMEQLITNFATVSVDVYARSTGQTVQAPYAGVLRSASTPLYYRDYAFVRLPSVYNSNYSDVRIDTSQWMQTLRSKINYPFGGTYMSPLPFNNLKFEVEAWLVNKYNQGFLVDSSSKLMSLDPALGGSVLSAEVEWDVNMDIEAPTSQLLTSFDIADISASNSNASLIVRSRIILQSLVSNSPNQYSLWSTMPRTFQLKRLLPPTNCLVTVKTSLIEPMFELSFSGHVPIATTVQPFGLDWMYEIAFWSVNSIGSASVAAAWCIGTDQAVEIQGTSGPVATASFKYLGSMRFIPIDTSFYVTIRTVARRPVLPDRPEMMFVPSSPFQSSLHPELPMNSYRPAINPFDPILYPYLVNNYQSEPDWSDPEDEPNNSNLFAKRKVQKPKRRQLRSGSSVVTKDRLSSSSTSSSTTISVRGARKRVVPDPSDGVPPALRELQQSAANHRLRVVGDLSEPLSITIKPMSEVSSTSALFPSAMISQSIATTQTLAQVTSSLNNQAASQPITRNQTSSAQYALEAETSPAVVSSVDHKASVTSADHNLSVSSEQVHRAPVSRRSAHLNNVTNVNNSSSSSKTDAVPNLSPSSSSQTRKVSVSVPIMKVQGNWTVAAPETPRSSTQTLSADSNDGQVTSQPDVRARATTPTRVVQPNMTASMQRVTISPSSTVIQAENVITSPPPADHNQSSWPSARSRLNMQESHVEAVARMSPTQETLHQPAGTEVKKPCCTDCADHAHEPARKPCCGSTPSELTPAVVRSRRRLPGSAGPSSASHALSTTQSVIVDQPNSATLPLSDAVHPRHRRILTSNSHFYAVAAPNTDPRTPTALNQPVDAMLSPGTASPSVSGHSPSNNRRRRVGGL